MIKGNAINSLRAAATCAAIGLLSLACRGAGEGPVIKNLNANRITVLGHRGLSRGGVGPGIEIQAVAELLEMGADGAEVDVQLTRDNVLVIFHDRDLSGKTDCAGLVRDHTWAELDSCARRTNGGAGPPLARLEELFVQLTGRSGVTLSLDIKLHPGEGPPEEYLRQFANAINMLVVRHGGQYQVLVEGNSRRFHKLLKEIKSPVKQFISGGEMAKLMDLAGTLDLDGISIGSKVTRREVARAHERGLQIMTWTPKSRLANRLAIRKQPDIIQTDRPAHMLKVLGRYRSPGSSGG